MVYTSAKMGAVMVQLVLFWDVLQWYAVNIHLLVDQIKGNGYNVIKQIIHVTKVLKKIFVIWIFCKLRY